MAAKCKVKFQRYSNGGAAAVLLWHGHSLNYIGIPPGSRVTVSGMRAMKRRLMAGCTELVKDLMKHNRRYRRGR